MNNLFLRARAWWYLRVATNKIPPPNVQAYLVERLAEVKRGLQEIESRRQEIIEAGARQGKTISTEKALQYVELVKANYDGPDREAYVREIDRVVQEFRAKHGPEIPVDEAYRIMQEIEARYGK